MFFEVLISTRRTFQGFCTACFTPRVLNSTFLIKSAALFSGCRSSHHVIWLRMFGAFQDTQFSAILADSLEFFNIPEDQHASYFLVDTKTSMYQHLATLFTQMIKCTNTHFHKLLSTYSAHPFESIFSCVSYFMCTGNCNSNPECKFAGKTSPQRKHRQWLVGRRSVCAGRSLG